MAACSHGGQSIPEARSSGYIVPQGVYGGIGPSAEHLRVLLGDAPPNLYGLRLEKLNLGLLEVDAYDSNNNMTVLSKFDKPLVVNVLNFNNENGQVVANAQVPRTEYTQLRLVVSLSASEGVFRGGTMPLNFLTNTPTFSSVGAGSNTSTVPDGTDAVDIVVSQPFSIPQTEHNAVRVDFNAFESLDIQDDNLVSVPALFVAPVDEASTIIGRVVNTNNPLQGIANAVVVAYAPDGSIGNTTYTNSRGDFELQTLPNGTYSVQVYNNYTNATGRTFQSSSSSSQNVIAGPTVTISGGKQADAGSIQD